MKLFVIRHWPLVRYGSPQRGQALFPLVLVLTALLGLIGVTLAGAGYAQSVVAAQRAFAEQAKQAAQAGVDDALLRIARNPAWRNPGGYALNLNGVQAVVTVTGDPVVIDAAATVRDVQRKLRVVVEVSSSGGIQILSREELTS